MHKLVVGVLAVMLAAPALARRDDNPRSVPGRYIVYFDAPAVTEFDGMRAKDGSWMLEPTKPAVGQRLNASSKAIVAYRDHLAQQRVQVLEPLTAQRGRDLVVAGTVDLTAHAVILDLSLAEVALLERVKGIRAIVPDRIVERQTDAGPTWVGAPSAWQGLVGNGTNMGEGVVVGVLDGGINWDNDAFADPGPDGYDHANPFGSQLGLCSNAGTNCNDKLIGVYDFTSEGVQDGRDSDGHGTHVASTAVGNLRTGTVSGVTVDIDLPISGVAPHANLVTYKVCRSDDPNTANVDEDGCPTSGILMAIDQAVADGVPVINMSLGGGPTDPWTAQMASSLLNALSAGLLTVTSAGNGGPGPATVTTPGDAPWTLAVANISHDRRFANAVEALSGGNATPPADLVGVGLTDSFGPARIVHARDFGNALCGAGDPELMPNCEDHVGSSNPFAPGTFDGEIVVCDRGTYGRVEKGFNLRAAGAGGYILANTEAQGESIVGDDHCLPAVHLGAALGDEIRAWLDAGGDDHSGTISGQFATMNASDGDVLSASSSRGPNNTAPGTLKPEISAPGSSILAASHVGNDTAFLSGTSMASPHVAGAAALVLAANPSLTPAEISSLLVTTARNEGMRDSDNQTLAQPQGVGAGRLRVDLALDGGLVMSETGLAFNQANPSGGGIPSTLNLPGMVNDACFERCVFRRSVSAINGGSWTADVESVDGVSITVEPSAFDLAAGESQDLVVTIDVSTAPASVNNRAAGSLVLAAADPAVSPTRLIADVFSTPGDVPDRITISAQGNRGSSLVDLDGIVSLPDAIYPSFGLGRGQTVERNLLQDPTNNAVYDQPESGGFFQIATLATDGGVILAETIVQNNGDLDLFVGRDLNGDGVPSQDEELCQSTSPNSDESCLLTNAEAGDYWIFLQNWQSATPNSRDAARVRFAAIESNANSLVVTGPGSPAARDPFSLRVIWDDGRMRPGETWFGILQPETVSQPGLGQLGIIPVQLDIDPLSPPAAGDLGSLPAYALAPQESARFQIPAGAGHGRLFVDVPESSERLRVVVDSGRDIDLFVVREDASFIDADVPAVSSIDAPIASDIGAGGTHAVTIESPAAGRYYIVPVNNSDALASVLVQSTLVRSVGSIEVVQGLYFNPARNGAGFNLNVIAGQLIVQWYTYLEDGTPIWYFAQAPLDGTNQWHADLLQFRWNGAAASSTDVGNITLTFTSPTDVVFSFRLNGESGSEPYTAIVADNGCAAQGLAAEQNGLWFIPDFAGSGYSVLSLESGQTQINYLYDGQGFPRWVLGQGAAADGVIELRQFTGFCPGCGVVPTSSIAVGSNTYSFDSNAVGTMDTSLTFDDLVPGGWNSAGALGNLTPVFSCGDG